MKARFGHIPSHKTTVQVIDATTELLSKNLVVDGGYIGTGYHSVAVHVAVHKVGVVAVEQPAKGYSTVRQPQL